MHACVRLRLSIIMIISNLKPNCSPGKDAMSPKILCRIIHTIAITVSKVINKALHEFFPQG